jgi:hypothetical protein
LIRNSYNPHWKPPAPFVLVTIAHPLTGAAVQDFPAQLDTAADRTVIPEDIVASLGLDFSGLIQILGVGGTVEEMTLYPVSLGIQQLPPLVVEVVAHAKEKWVLLGRDVLNQYRIVLDGPNLTLEIG